MLAEEKKIRIKLATHTGTTVVKAVAVFALEHGLMKRLAILPVMVLTVLEKLLREGKIMLVEKDGEK